MDVQYIAIDPSYSDKTLKCSVCRKLRIRKNNVVDTGFFRSSTDPSRYFCSIRCHRKVTPCYDNSDRQTVADLFS